MLLIADLFWGLSFPAVKAVILITGRFATPDQGAWISAYAVMPRFTLAFLGLWAWHFLRPGRSASFGFTRSEMKQGIAIGVVTTIGMWLQTDGLRFTAASTSAFLTQFYVVVIPLWLALRSRQNPGLIAALSCVLVLAGMAILSHFDWRHVHFGRGEWETLLASGFFMSQILLIEDRSFAANRADRIVLIMLGVCAVLFSGYALTLAPSVTAILAPWTSGAWVALTLILAGFCTLAGFMIMTAWQPKLTSTEAGLVYCIEPIFGSIFALFLPALFSAWALIAYPNEHATMNLLVGGGLITLANVLIQLRPWLSQRRRPQL